MEVYTPTRSTEEWGVTLTVVQGNFGTTTAMIVLSSYVVSGIRAAVSPVILNYQRQVIAGGSAVQLKQSVPVSNGVTKIMPNRPVSAQWAFRVRKEGMEGWERKSEQCRKIPYIGMCSEREWCSRCRELQTHSSAGVSLSLRAVFIFVSEHLCVCASVP